MGLQLIICVETNKKNNSDYIYVRSVIDHFYDLGPGKVRLSPVYMEGKGNYSSKTVKNKISDLEKKFSATSKNNHSAVIMCFDCDDYSTDAKDATFLKNAEIYCRQNDYDFVWFCRDIEEVFLGKRISDAKKKAEAERFFINDMIKVVSPDDLRAEQYKNRMSNICAILDKWI